MNIYDVELVRGSLINVMNYTGLIEISTMKGGKRFSDG